MRNENSRFFGELGMVSKLVAEVVKTFGAMPKPKPLTGSATKIELLRQSLVLCVSLSLSLCVWGVGCGSTAGSGQSKFEHSHEHAHGAGQDPRHKHENFEGSHSHAYEHEHRQGEALFGGWIAPVGHTHQESGETHYAVEVMPIENNSLSLYFLVEKDSKLDLANAKFNETTAYMGEPDAPPAMAREVTFQADEDAASYSTEVPEFLHGKEKIEVVFARVEFGGESLSFNIETGYPEAEMTPDDGSAASTEADVEPFEDESNG